MTRRERLEAKAERRREWAASREKKSEAGFESAQKIADGIPFGQPILVGHHSERHARRDQARIESGMVAGHENAKVAANHSNKADGIDRQLAASVFSDDADAPERLREQIAELEAERDRIKAYNASCRSRKGAGDASLLEPSQREDILTTARVAAYQLGKYGEFPSYHLSNLGARIREKKARVERIERDRERVASGDRGPARHMEARYGGVCADCGEPFDKGDRIAWYRLTKEAVHADYVDGIRDAVCPTTATEVTS